MNTAIDENINVPIVLNNRYYGIGDNLALSNRREIVQIECCSPTNIILVNSKNEKIYYSSIRDLKENLYTNELIKHQLFSDYLNCKNIKPSNLKASLKIIDLINIKEANPFLNIDKSMELRIDRLENYLLNEKVKKEILLLQTLNPSIVLKLILKSINENLKDIYKVLLLNTSIRQGFRLFSQQFNGKSFTINDPIYDYFKIGLLAIDDTSVSFITNNGIYNYETDTIYCEFKKILESNIK